MITIINYGMGNLGSTLNMFKRLGIEAQISSDPDIIVKSKKLVLPGVGAFDSAITRINAMVGLREVLQQKAMQDKIPVLGICLGMQLMTNSSEEGELLGFQWIDAQAKKFPNKIEIKVPHMGWNTVQSQNSHPVVNSIEADSRYYFVHSYYVDVNDANDSLLKTFYGIEFDSAIGRDNIVGVQFHPEKSHRFGMQLLTQFADM